jgi:hypothetical protein
MKFNGRYEAGGKAYLYYGSPHGLSLTNFWSAEYDLPITKGIDDIHEQFFSCGLSSASDVNGDGFDDVAIGAWYAERGDRNEGLAFVFHGSPRGLAEKPAWIAEGNHAHALFGQSLATAFDVNGDGYDDVLVAAPQASNGQQLEGAVVIYRGSRKGLARSPSGTIEGDHSHERLGEPVRCAGDINGDGYPDVLLVGPGYQGTRSDNPVERGRLVVCFGGPNGLPFTHEWSPNKPLPETANFCASASALPAKQVNIGSGNNQRGETLGPAPALQLRAAKHIRCRTEQAGRPAGRLCYPNHFSNTL